MKTPNANSNSSGQVQKYPGKDQPLDKEQQIPSPNKAPVESRENGSDVESVEKERDIDDDEEIEGDDGSESEKEDESE